MATLAPPPAQASSPRASAELPDSQAPTLAPPTAHSSPRHEHATLPPSEEPASSVEPAPAPAPAPNPTDIAVTFLLISGKRQTMHFDPSVTFGRAKEAFWGAWTPENAADKPPTPSFLRILHMGRDQPDNQTLTAAKFPNVSTNPAGTIVHVSVGLFGPPAEEDIVKAKRISRRFLNPRTTDSSAPATNRATTNSETPNSNAGCCGCIIC